MDVLELYRLGRRLMKIGEAAASAGGATAGKRLPTGVALILADIYEHRDTSIGHIADRTGFPQSHVSASVARLRERGAVETVVDPADGRRTLVRVSPAWSEMVAERWTIPVDDALATAIGSTDPHDIEAVVATLESLADRLLRPEGRHRIDTTARTAGSI